MAGLVPAIHAFALSKKQDVDARDKRGHDERVSRARENTSRLSLATARSAEMTLKP
jgi:hypothetical protein